MKKVLIAEDDRILLKILEKELVKYADQFHTILVCDGQEAITALKNESIDMVVTDIQMPRTNGLMLLAYIHTYHPTIPCIIITSYATRRVQSKVPRRVLRFFQKPFKAEDLSQSILAVLNRGEPYYTAEGLTVVSYLGMIELEAISCAFAVEGPDGKTGVFYFEKGILLDAEAGRLQGERAALELIQREIAKCTFRDLPEPVMPRRIKADLEQLIRTAVMDDPEIELPVF